MRPALIVASMLAGHGQSGVETHVHAIVARAREAGFAAEFISAQSDKDWRRRLSGLWRRLVHRVDRERALLVELEADGAQLVRHLRQAIADAGDAPLAIYAQDPLSARAALNARGSRPVRVVMTVHFNVSEAQEMVVRGLTRLDGVLWTHLSAVERDVLPRLDHLIFVSAFMRDILLRRHPRLAGLACSLIPNFCTPPRAASTHQNTHGSSPGTAQTPDATPGAAVDAVDPHGDLIAIGSLEPRKNQAFLLQVLAACNRRQRRYRCTIVGDGPDAGLLKDQAWRLGLAAQVHFLGHRAAAAELIPAHRVLVHGATMENLPITLIEALACARPVLAAAVGGIPEVIEDGVQGYLWPLDDVEAAASRLVDLLESPGCWERMSAAARERYDRVFSNRVLVPRWLASITGGAAGVQAAGDAASTAGEAGARPAS